jgi:predicted AlkP superfamily phosphohydrolase/phosphomutase
MDVEGDPPLMKTLLIGLDAASPDIIDGLFESGTIPNIQSVYEDGVDGPLRSQVPPWTASAWPSMYTGVNPGKHGVYDFLYFEGYDWDIVNRTRVREAALWELLDHHGLTSVVVNVPVTDPARPFSGALIPGYVSSEPPRAHPEGIFEEVRDAIGGYDIYNPNTRETREERIAGYLEMTRQRGAAMRYLTDKFDPDFGFVQFQQTDTVFHEYPDDEDAARQVYAAVDREVGEIIAHCEPETVFIVSDHGIGVYTGYEFRVNDFLREHGYVEATRTGGGMPSWTTLNAQRRSKNGKRESERAVKPHPMTRVMQAGARVGLTSQRMGAVLDRLGLTSFVASRVPREAVRAATEQVDFRASKAYMRSRIELGVRINLRGREPDGVVAPADYEQVRNELIELLRAVRTPDSGPVFESVARREDLFEGPYVEEAPDIIVVPNGYDNHLSATLLGEEFGELDRFYEHKPIGVIAASGAGIDATASLEGAHLFDVAPTVLASFSLPASDRMDGTTLEVVDAVGTEAYPPFEVTERARTEDSAVEERLADIGYLE